MLLLKLVSKAIRPATGALALMLATLSEAHAYVDPGTGAMIIQVVGAAVVGGMFYFRTIRDKIASWFTRSGHHGDAPKDEQK